MPFTRAGVPSTVLKLTEGSLTLHFQPLHDLNDRRPAPAVRQRVCHHALDRWSGVRREAGADVLIDRGRDPIFPASHVARVLKILRDVLAGRALVLG